MSIHRSFYKHNTIPENENDIWVERIVLGGNKGPQTYFKSLYGNERRREPPTGATTIIYLEDMIERKDKPNKQKEQQVTPANHDASNDKGKTNVVATTPKKKASFFGFLFPKGGRKGGKERKPNGE
jgi:hypothetical protein